MIIFLALPGGTVIGILLGHCIFGANGKVVAKYFLHVVYDLEGNILAKDSEYVNPEGIDISKMQEEAWKIIAVIEDHDCPRIKPHNKWSTFSLEEYFAQKKI